MAITTQSPGTLVGFIRNSQSADVSLTEIIAEKVTGKSIHLKHLTVNSTDAIAITIGESENANNVLTALIGPIEFAALETLQWDFWSPLVLTSDLDLTIDADGAGVVSILAQGTWE
jgi:hypothetical protein